MFQGFRIIQQLHLGVKFFLFLWPKLGIFQLLYLKLIQLYLFLKLLLTLLELLQFAAEFLHLLILPPVYLQFLLYHIKAVNDSPVIILLQQQLMIVLAMQIYQIVATCRNTEIVTGLSLIKARLPEERISRRKIRLERISTALSPSNVLKEE